MCECDERKLKGKEGVESSRKGLLERMPGSETCLTNEHELRGCRNECEHVSRPYGYRDGDRIPEYRSSITLAAPASRAYDHYRPYSLMTFALRNETMQCCLPEYVFRVIVARVCARVLAALGRPFNVYV